MLYAIRYGERFWRANSEFCVDLYLATFSPDKEYLEEINLIKFKLYGEIVAIKIEVLELEA